MIQNLFCNFVYLLLYLGLIMFYENLTKLLNLSGLFWHVDERAAPRQLTSEIDLGLNNNLEFSFSSHCSWREAGQLFYNQIRFSSVRGGNPTIWNLAEAIVEINLMKGVFSQSCTFIRLCNHLCQYMLAKSLKTCWKKFLCLQTFSYSTLISLSIILVWVQSSVKFSPASYKWKFVL